MPKGNRYINLLILKCLFRKWNFNRG